MVTICLGELWMLVRVRASSSKSIYKSNCISSIEDVLSSALAIEMMTICNTQSFIY